MSQPSFPQNANFTREDVVNQILSSIAMEELGLSHIINAEGEKLQYILGTLPGLTGPCRDDRRPAECQYQCSKPIAKRIL